MRNIFVCLVIAFSAIAVRADGVPVQNPQAVSVPSERPMFAQVGRATYYHGSLHGLRTANGERFDAQAMTAAHRRLKFNTYVRVTNLRNQRSVVVRINDRLPPRSRAIIDLTHKAARQLGMFRRGVSKVKLEIVDKAEFIAANSAPQPR